MHSFLEEYLKDKKILILGIGREGRSTYGVLRNISTYRELAIADMNAQEPPFGDSVRVIGGEGYLDVHDEYDLVIKSPGVALPRDFSDYRCEITSQIELFLMRFGNQTVGITGTKGKSTTSSLLYHVLQKSGCDCVFGGNIGIPVFDIAEDISDGTTVVLELSCHQLEHISVAPKTAVLLNMYEDHLDRYGTFERYAETKKNIYRRQKSGDVLFCNPNFFPAEGDCISTVRGVYPEQLPSFPSRLKGEHNRYDISVVCEVCRHLGISDSDIALGVADFRPLAHRLEYVGTKDGIDYYDDSISTTVESTIGAIKSIENIGTVLIGGMERGIDYQKLIDFLLVCNIDNVIFMYSSGKRIYDEIVAIDRRTATNFSYVPDLSSAVEQAKKITAHQKACVLSPAAASYGSFKNFEERGDVFCRLAGF